jgi:methylenetetrahydrofolate reductase (NADPH)
VGSTVEQLRNYLQRATEKNIANVVALRGDPPRGEAGFEAVEGGFRYASELVQLIRREFDHLGIAVAGYPESHQEATSPEDDLRHLKHKVDCGADIVITQLFYNNEDFLRFRDRCEKIGIRIPIIPGLLPVTNFAQIQRITAMCGAKLPANFVADLEAAGDADEAQFEVGVAQATAQTEQLIREGVPGIHFYVLNKSQAATRVLDAVSRGDPVARQAPR